jgi:hypothetical protein
MTVSSILPAAPMMRLPFGHPSIVTRFERLGIDDIDHPAAYA